MEQKPAVTPSSPPSVQKPDPSALLALQVEQLTKIERHLNTIRSILVLFAILTVISGVLAACSIILTYMGLTP